MPGTCCRFRVQGLLEVGEGGVEDFEHLDGRQGYACAGTEDGGDASAVEEVIVLGGNNAAGGDHDVFATELFEFVDYLGHECFVACGEGADAENVDVVLNGHAGCFGRGLEQRTHVDVEAAVGVACGYDFGAAVVAVLAHFCNHDAGLTALAFCEFFGELAGTHEFGVVFGFC